MGEINIVVRTADKTRKSDLIIDDTQTGGDILQAAIEKWNLDHTIDYTITDVTTSPPRTLPPSASLASAMVTTGSTLEIQPLLRAG